MNQTCPFLLQDCVSPENCTNIEECYIYVSNSFGYHSINYFQYSFLISTWDLKEKLINGKITEM